VITSKTPTCDDSRLICAYLVAIDDNPCVTLEVALPLNKLTFEGAAINIELFVDSCARAAGLEVAVLGELAADATAAIELYMQVVLPVGISWAGIW
jgi:hypothetical protein